MIDGLISNPHDRKEDSVKENEQKRVNNRPKFFNTFIEIIYTSI